MVDYVTQYGITDIVFANNVFKAYAGGRQYLRFLTQRGSGLYVPPVQETDSLAQDSTAAVGADSVAPALPDSATGHAADSMSLPAADSTAPAAVPDSMSPAQVEPVADLPPADTAVAEQSGEEVTK